MDEYVTFVCKADDPHLAELSESIKWKAMSYTHAIEDSDYWESMYEKEKQRCEMLIAKYEKDIEALEKASSKSASNPLTESTVNALYKNLADDERTKSFTPQNWFQAGIATSEGILLSKEDENGHIDEPPQRKPWVSMTKEGHRQIVRAAAEIGKSINNEN